MAKKPAHKGPIGLPLVDRLDGLDPCALDDYLKGVSEYVRDARNLSDGARKAAQVRLSAALGRALLAELRRLLPDGLEDAVSGEKVVSGALRAAKADASEMHSLDGLRLAVELKPVNLAVGRAIWNRFGDIRTFAVNVHLKFPFAVVGGVLVVPTSEEGPNGRKSTTHLISRAVNRLVRAGGRRTEGDAPHLLEGIAVVVYDPETGLLDQALPAKGTGLRWPEFVDAMANAYSTRFGEGELAAVDDQADAE
jgi:hypothetical protein